jgi:class 3 adenylate cyclase
MQSFGVPGRIQVSPSTREQLRETHAFEERDPIDVKGLGVMAPYLLQLPASSNHLASTRSAP